jgi:hypothetical protein
VRRRTLGLLLLPLTAVPAGGCASAATTATAAPSASATPWLVTYGGRAGPSVAPRVAYGSRSPFPTGFLPLGPAAAAPAPSASAGCAPVRFHAGRINYADVVAGPTSATVTWYDPGGTDLKEYRVTAISQNPVVGDQRDVGWTVIRPGPGCGMLSAPVTGLDPGTSYVFSVDAVVTVAGEDGTRARTIARSLPTRTS